MEISQLPYRSEEKKPNRHSGDFGDERRDNNKKGRRTLEKTLCR